MAGSGMLHAFCGKIASGKSSLAASLANAPQTILISEDQLLSRLYPGEVVTIDDYVRVATRLRAAIGPHLEKLLRTGLNIVLDFQANTPASRAWVRSVAERADAEHILHVLDVPDEVCRSRLAERNAAGAHEYQVSEADFELFNSYVVPPTSAEGFNVVVHANS
ncbi:ATP-binding protein [Sphingomonas sp. NSE70-1]|uniref:ATP-binding protein n=1 Tax=Sphingomonas caseinilyticus TaxID=2908205 RepID=A0ABT0RX72_9SPHN|nr:ATP-binding protein [Sphingomonas caseinilyticus]MCL6699624.1 ATP-binding protein [Sphingomonas caseinilyticus]